MRIVFFGTPEFAVPTLRRLAEMPEVEVALVVTQPDRPSGRGRRLERSAVGQAAAGLKVPVFQPAGLRAEADRQPLADAHADLFVVAAYGVIFGPKTLALPRLGCVNVHASLLPRYRGASPVAAAILLGERRTGVTLMRMEPGLDTGPVIAAAAIDVEPTDTTASLMDRLALVGADLIGGTLGEYAAGTRPPVPQPERDASLTRLLSKDDGWLDWEQPADQLERHVRAMWPWPRAWTTVGEPRLQIHRATVVPHLGEEPSAGVLQIRPDFVVSTGDGALRLDVVQAAGSRPMPGDDFAAGRGIEVGTYIGIAGAPSERRPLIERLS